jgi:uncharacterized membrane protein
VAHAENEVEINKPVGEVYRFIADGLNNPKWRPGVVSIELAAGTAGQVGADYKQVLKGPGGRNISGDYKITAAVQDKALSFVVTAGPARPTGDFAVESAGNGAKVRFVLDFQPKGFAKLMGPMIQKTMNGEVGQLTSLKQVLESR